MMVFKNRLMEAVIKDSDLGEAGWKEAFVAKARTNAFVGKAMKEYVTSDAISALGKIHDVAIEAAENMAVGRDMIWVVPTTEALVRFFLAKRGAVWRISEGPPPQSPERFEKVDISVDYEYGYDAVFSQAYIEDTPFSVLQRAVSDAAQLLEEQLTTDVIALYDGIAAGELAGGAIVNTATSGTLAWADIVEARQQLKLAGYAGKVLVAHPYEIADLWNDEKFIHSMYFGNLVDVRRGVLGETYLGFKILSTDLMALDAGGGNGNYAYLIDTDVAAACLMRRDILTQPYEERLSQGTISTIRYGLGTLRKDAVCRIDIVHV